MMLLHALLLAALLCVPALWFIRNATKLENAAPVEEWDRF